MRRRGEEGKGGGGEQGKCGEFIWINHTTYTFKYTRFIEYIIFTTQLIGNVDRSS